MSATRILALVLVAAGVLGLIYGGFDYVRDTHDAKLGGLEFAIRSRHTILVPTWLSLCAIGAGIALLLRGRSRP